MRTLIFSLRLSLFRSILSAFVRNPAACLAWSNVLAKIPVDPLSSGGVLNPDPGGVSGLHAEVTACCSAGLRCDEVDKDRLLEPPDAAESRLPMLLLGVPLPPPLPLPLLLPLPPLLPPPVKRRARSEKRVWLSSASSTATIILLDTSG